MGWGRSNVISRESKNQTSARRESHRGNQRSESLTMWMCWVNEFTSRRHLQQSESFAKTKNVLTSRGVQDVLFPSAVTGNQMSQNYHRNRSFRHLRGNHVQHLAAASFVFMERVVFCREAWWEWRWWRTLLLHHWIMCSYFSVVHSEGRKIWARGFLVIYFERAQVLQR